MTAKGRLTRARLTAELRSLLARPDTKIRLRKLRKNCGQSEWIPDPPRDITITLDPRRDGRVPLVIHELVHVYGRERGLFKNLSQGLEEALVVAWEWEVWSYAKRSTASIERWDRAITRKIGGARAAR